MLLQPHHQDNTRALALGSAKSRRGGLPAYYLGRPAGLWISATSPARRAEHPHTPGGRRHR